MEVALIFIALFAAAFGIMYVYYTSRNRERLAMIEKGADASMFNRGKEKGTARKPVNWNKFTLKTGMLFMGVAIGIIIAAIMSNARMLTDGANYPSMIFFFGGLSLVLYYFIEKRIN